MGGFAEREGGARLQDEWGWHVGKDLICPRLLIDTLRNLFLSTEFCFHSIPIEAELL